MRWFGALLLALMSYMLGVIIAKREHEKLQTVESLILFFGFMRRRMLSERAPLFDVFSSYNDEFLESIGFLPQLRSHRSGVSGNWKNALTYLAVDDEISRELSLFGNELGTLSLNEQIKRIDACVSALEEKKKALSVSIPNKQKCIKTVCLLTGVLAAIIML